MRFSAVQHIDADRSYRYHRVPGDQQTGYDAATHQPEADDSDRYFVRIHFVKDLD
jgi:hypothetical protein